MFVADLEAGVYKSITYFTGLARFQRGGNDCETSRLPHFPDNRLTDGGEVVSLTSRLPFVLRKISGT
jgi:hypothetical protein